MPQKLSSTFIEAKPLTAAPVFQGRMGHLAKFMATDPRISSAAAAAGVPVKVQTCKNALKLGVGDLEVQVTPHGRGYVLRARSRRRKPSELPANPRPWTKHYDKVTPTNRRHAAGFDWVLHLAAQAADKELGAKGLRSEMK